jgi:hypothetical protein
LAFVRQAVEDDAADVGLVVVIDEGQVNRRWFGGAGEGGGDQDDK